jgi:hypothetical protein
MSSDAMIGTPQQIAILYRGPGYDLAAATPVAVRVGGCIYAFDSTLIDIRADGSVRIGGQTYRLARVLGQRPAGQDLEIGALYDAERPAITPASEATVGAGGAVGGLGPGYYIRGTSRSSGSRGRRGTCKDCTTCHFNRNGRCANPNKKTGRGR